MESTWGDPLDPQLRAGFSGAEDPVEKIHGEMVATSFGGKQRGDRLIDHIVGSH